MTLNKFFSPEDKRMTLLMKKSFKCSYVNIGAESSCGKCGVLALFNLPHLKNIFLEIEDNSWHFYKIDILIALLRYDSHT